MPSVIAVTTAGDFVTTLAADVTITAETNAVILDYHIRQGSGFTAYETPTLDGVDGTLIIERQLTASDPERRTAAWIWLAADLPAASGTPYSVSVTSFGDRDMGMAVKTLSGAAQSVPTETASDVWTANQLSNTVTVVDAPAGSLVFDALGKAGGSTAVSFAGGQTEQYEFQATTPIRFAGSSQPAASTGDYTFDNSWGTNADQGVHIAYAVEEEAAAPESADHLITIVRPVGV